MEQDGKLVRKIKEDPGVPIGVAAMLFVVGYGTYKYRTSRKTMSLSVFLMQLRVAAQSAVIGCITIGVMFNAAKTFFTDNKKDSKS